MEIASPKKFFMAPINANCCPHRIIHGVVRIQAAIRRYLGARDREVTESILYPHCFGTSVTLAIYLARRLRNGSWMDVDREVDILCDHFAAMDPLHVASAFSIIQYCKKMSLTSQRSYIILNERLWATISGTQARFQLMLSDASITPLDVIRTVALLNNCWPVELHHYLDFALLGAQQAIKRTEAELLKELDASNKLQDLVRLAIAARERLEQGSLVHAVIQRRLEMRRNSLLQEIWVMYDRPLLEGIVPVLEAAAFMYTNELPMDDPVLRDFVIDICFLTVKYIRDLEVKFDIRDEIKTFEFCKKLGPEYVFPILKKNMTPLDFNSTVVGFLTSLESSENMRGDIFRTQVTRIRRASGLANLRPDISDFDPGCIWDLLGDGFELPPLPQLKADTDRKDSEKTTPQPPHPSNFRRPRLTLPDPPKPTPHDPYTYFNSDTIFRIPVEDRKFVVTRTL